MPINPADFCAVADQLRKEVVVAGGEARDRTILGRLYYGAYLAVRDAVRTKYGDRRFDVRHEELFRALKVQLDADVQEVGDRLATLFHWRVQADYQHGVALMPSVVTLMFLNAQQILAALPKVTPKLPAGIPRRF